MVLASSGKGDVVDPSGGVTDRDRRRGSNLAALVLAIPIAAMDATGCFRVEVIPVCAFYVVCGYLFAARMWMRSTAGTNWPNYLNAMMTGMVSFGLFGILPILYFIGGMFFSRGIGPAIGLLGSVAAVFVWASGIIVCGVIGLVVCALQRRYLVTRVRR